MFDLIPCSWRNDLSKFGSILCSSTCSMNDEIGQILASAFPMSLEPLLITCLLFASSSLFLHWWDVDFGYNTFVKVGQLSSLIQIFVVFDPHTGVSAYLCSFSVWQYCVPPTRYKLLKDRDCDTFFYSLYYLFKSSLILKSSPFPCAGGGTQYLMLAKQVLYLPSPSSASLSPTLCLSLSHSWP